jgi:hypothetical protein
MDALAAKYDGRVKFLLVYGYEPHPDQMSNYGIHGDEHKRVDAPRTLAARREFAADFRDYYHVKRTIVVDDFDEKSAAWRLFGTTSYSHPVVIVDAAGRVIFRNSQPEPAELDGILRRLQ